MQTKTEEPKRKKKRFKREVELCAPIHMFVSCPESRKYLKKRKIKTVEEFLKTGIIGATKNVHEFLKNLKRKMNKGLQMRPPAMIAEQILKHKPVKQRISVWALNTLSTIKSLINAVSRKQREFVMFIAEKMLRNKWMIQELKSF